MIRATSRALGGISAAAVCLAGAASLAPAAVWAADPHPEEATATHAAEAAHAAPSLFSVEPGLLIWTIVTFLVVLVVLRMTAWGPLMEALAEREQRISGAIQEADRIKSEAQQLFARYQTMMDKAKDEAHSILDEARRDGLAVQEEIRRKAHEEAEHFKERARREIELAKDGAVHELWEQAAGLSTELATRILGRSLDQKDQDRLVRELIQEMRADETPAGKA